MHLLPAEPSSLSCTDWHYSFNLLLPKEQFCITKFLFCFVLFSHRTKELDFLQSRRKLLCLNTQWCAQEPEIKHGVACYLTSFPHPYLWSTCSLSLWTQIPQPANQRNAYFINSSPTTTSSSGQWKMCLILSQCISSWPLPSLQTW